jgi:hypothetical protein
LPFVVDSKTGADPGNGWEMLPSRKTELDVFFTLLLVELHSVAQHSVGEIAAAAMHSLHTSQVLYLSLYRRFNRSVIANVHIAKRVA